MNFQNIWNQNEKIIEYSHGKINWTILAPTMGLANKLKYKETGQMPCSESTHLSAQ